MKVNLKLNKLQFVETSNGYITTIEKKDKVYGIQWASNWTINQILIALNDHKGLILSPCWRPYNTTSGTFLD